MSTKERNKAIARIVSFIRKEFVAKGWNLLGKPGTDVYLIKNVSDCVVQKLVVYEPLKTSSLPQGAWAGFACEINVLYPELNQFVKDVCGESFPPLTVRLALSEVLPPDQVFAQTVLLFNFDEKEASLIGADFVRMYEKYLEPVRVRLSSYGVFLDEDYVPPGVIAWDWKLLRTVYYRLYSSKGDWMGYAKKLDAQANAVLGDEVDENVSRIYSNISELGHASQVRDARRAKLLIQALTGFQ